MLRTVLAYALAIALSAGAVAGVVVITAPADAVPSGFRTATVRGAGPSDRFPTPPAGADGPAGRCVVCHSLEAGGAPRFAPSLSGIVGAPKASARWFAYSKALAEAGGAWTRDALDRYLADPDAFLPGTKKTLSGIADPAERAQLIDYLATLSG